jgi:hypothetical protein
MNFVYNGNAHTLALKFELHHCLCMCLHTHDDDDPTENFMKTVHMDQIL